MKSEETREQRRKHRSLWKLIVLVLVLIIGIFSYAHYRLQSTARKIQTNQNVKLPQKLKDGQPFTVLIMGTDVGALGRGTSYAGNTDTMELATVNPQQKKIFLTAVPRDILVKVQTKEGADYVKINASYVIGGAKEAKKQVSELLDVPVDYYALVNMGTMKKVVNAVGGVEVDNPFVFHYEGHYFKKGKQHLNGNEALKYSRMRYDDPNNDYGRQKRGQQVIESVAYSFKRHGSVSAVNEIMSAISEGVRTDLPINKAEFLYLRYHAALNKTETDHLQGKNAVIDGASFQIATPKEMVRVSNKVRRSLGRPTINHLNNCETRLYHYQTTWNGYNNLSFALPHGAQYNTPGSGY